MRRVGGGVSGLENRSGWMMRGGSQNWGSRMMRRRRWGLERARRATGGWQAGKGSMFLGGGRGSWGSQGRGVEAERGRFVDSGRDRA